MVGGVLAGTLGWRAVFVINIPVGVAALALAPRVLREQRGERRPLDLRKAGLATFGLAALVYALAEHQWLLLAPALLALAVVVRRPKRPAVAGAFATAALLTAATSGAGVLATLELQTHLGPFEAGLHLLPLSLAVIAGSLVAGRRHVPISVGLGLVALGSALAPLSLTAWAILAGAGLGAASVTATALGMKDAEDPGSTAGLLTTAAQVGTAIGVATLVGLPDSGYGVAAAFTAAGAALALWRPRVVSRTLESAPR
jgi:MFS family permease